jgi:hypothetical protein
MEFYCMLKSTKVDVEHGGVGALDEDILASSEGLVQKRHGLDDHWTNHLSQLLIPFQLRLHVDLQVREHPLVGSDQNLEPDAAKLIFNILINLAEVLLLGELGEIANKICDANASS